MTYQFHIMIKLTLLLVHTSLPGMFKTMDRFRVDLETSKLEGRPDSKPRLGLSSAVL